jgi:hypothetical protein
MVPMYLREWLCVCRGFVSSKPVRCIRTIRNFPAAACNLSVSYDGLEDRQGCSSVGISVAPVPTSILSLESQFNKTYTPMNLGGTSANSPSAASATAVQTSNRQSAATATSAQSTSEATRRTHEWNGYLSPMMSCFTAGVLIMSYLAQF